MAGKPVGHIRVRVSPDTTKFNKTLQARMKRWEAHYRKNPVMVQVDADVNERSFYQARKRIKELLSGADTRVTIEAVVNKSDLARVRREMKNAVKNVSPTLRLDPAQVAKFSAQVKALSKTLPSGVSVPVRARPDVASIAATRRTVEAGIGRGTIWRNVGAMWLPGTFDGLKNAFFRQFPYMKMWVWPEIDTDVLKAGAAKAKQSLSKYFADVKFVYNVDSRHGVSQARKAFNAAKMTVRAVLDQPGLVRDLHRVNKDVFSVAQALIRVGLDSKSLAVVRAALAGFRAKTVTLGVKLAEGAVGKAKAGLALLEKPLVAVVRPVLDKGAVAKAFLAERLEPLHAKIQPVLDKGAMAKAYLGLRLEPFRAKIEPVLDKSAMVVVRAQMGRLWSAIRFKVRPHLDRTAMRVTQSKIALALKATLGKKAMIRLGADTKRATASLWRFYTSSGLRKLRRYNIQLGITGTMVALRQLRSIVGATSKLTAVFSTFGMGAASVLKIIGSIKNAIVSMGPALGAVGGVAASFGAGFLIAGVALKNAKTELASLQGPLNTVKAQINAAFWGEARVPVLENAQALLTGLGPQIEGVAGAMGRLTAGLAQGAGKSMGEFNTLLDNTRAGFDILAGTGERFVETLMRIVGAGSAFFPQFAAWLDELSVKFESYIQKVSEGPGGLQGWIQGGIDAALLFGSTIKNLFGLLNDVSSLAAGAGSGMAGFNESLISIRETIATPEMQAGLTAMFSGAAEGSRAMVSGITEIISKLGEFGPQVGAIMANVGTAFGTVGHLLANAFGNEAVMGALENLSSTFVVLVGALSPVVEKLVTGFAPILDKITGLIDQLMPSISDVLDVLADLALVSFDAIADLAAIILPPLLDVINAILPQIMDMTTTLLPPLIGLIQQIMPILAEIVQVILQHLIDLYTPLIEPMSNLIQAILPPILELILALLPPLAQLIQAFMPVLVSVIEALIPVLEVIVNVIGAVLPPIITFISSLIQALVPIIQGVIDVFMAIASAAVDVWNGIKSAVSTAINAVSATIKAVTSTISSVWNAAWNGIKSFVSSTWEGIKSIFSTAAGWARTTFNKIGNAISAPFRAAFNGIRSLWNSTIGKLSWTVPDWVPIIGGSSISAPKLAEGGITTGPVMAMIGEKPRYSGGHVQEAVIPLPQIEPYLATALGSVLSDRAPFGGGGVVVQHLSVGLTGADVRDVRSLAEFVDMLNVESRMRNGVRG